MGFSYKHLIFHKILAATPVHKTTGHTPRCQAQEKLFLYLKTHYSEKTARMINRYVDTIASTGSTDIEPHLEDGINLFLREGSDTRFAQSNRIALSIFHLIELAIYAEKYPRIPIEKKMQHIVTIVLTGHPSNGITEGEKDRIPLYQDIFSALKSDDFDPSSIRDKVKELLDITHRPIKPTLRNEIKRFWHKLFPRMLTPVIHLAKQVRVKFKDWRGSEADRNTVTAEGTILTQSMRCKAISDIFKEQFNDIHIMLMQHRKTASPTDMTYTLLDPSIIQSITTYVDQVPGNFDVIEETAKKIALYKLTLFLYEGVSQEYIDPNEKYSNLPEHIRNKYTLLLEAPLIDAMQITPTTTAHELLNHLSIQSSKFADRDCFSFDIKTHVFTVNPKNINLKLEQLYKRVHDTIVSSEGPFNSMKEKIESLIEITSFKLESCGENDPQKPLFEELKHRLSTLIDHFDTFGFLGIQGQGRLDAQQIRHAIQHIQTTSPTSPGRFIPPDIIPELQQGNLQERLHSKEVESKEEFFQKWEEINALDYFFASRCLNASNRPLMSDMIIANCEAAQDFKAFFYLAIKAGEIKLNEDGQVIEGKMRIKMLFEDVDSFNRAPGILQTLLEDQTIVSYFQHIGCIPIMYAFSDTSRSDGTPAATIALMTAYLNLKESVKQYISSSGKPFELNSMPIIIEHGRGVRISRNGGLYDPFWQMEMLSGESIDSETTEQAGAAETDFLDEETAERYLNFMAHFTNKEKKTSYRQDLLKLTDFLKRFPEFTSKGRELWNIFKKVDSSLNTYLSQLLHTDIVINEVKVGSRDKARKDVKKMSIIGDNRAITVSALNRLNCYEMGTIFPFVQDMKNFLGDLDPSLSVESVDTRSLDLEKLQELQTLFRENRAFQVLILKIWEGVLMSKPQIIKEWEDLTRSKSPLHDFKSEHQLFEDAHNNARQYLTLIMGCSPEDFVFEKDPTLTTRVQRLSKLQEDQARFAIRQTQLRREPDLGSFEAFLYG